MDPRLYEACREGQVHALRELHRENNSILSQRTQLLLNSVLHIASSFGKAELVTEIIQLQPDMVLIENKKMETPLHEACRYGHIHVSEIILATNAGASAAYKLNQYNESALSLACHGGHVDMVNFLLSNQPNILKMEEQEGGFSTSLHVAASRGYGEIVQQLLRACPGLATYSDSEGRMPLHWATIKGQESAIEILSMNRELLRLPTQNKESVLHLSVKSNQYKTVKFLMERPLISDIVNSPDNDGNTALHLAAVAKLSPIIKLLLSKKSVDVTVVNNGGLTALDILRNDPCDIDDKEIVKLLKYNPSARFSGLSFKSRMYENEERETARYMLNMLIVVAALIASVTFQAGLNPPGGSWQDWNPAGNSTGTNSSVPVNSAGNNSDYHKPGKSIPSQLLRSPFNNFTYANSVAFFLSSGIIYFRVYNLSGITPMRNLSLTKLVLTAATLSMALAFITGGRLVTDTENKYRLVGIYICTLGLNMFTVLSVRFWCTR